MRGLKYDIQKKMEMISLGLGSSIIIGIVSGIIASVCFAVFLLMVKPKVKISDQICIENAGGADAVYRIKIVNHTFAMLTNLRYVLVYCEMHGDGINTITEIKPRKSQIISIDRFNLRKDDTDYAVRISYDIDPQKYPLNDRCKLEFTFIADHSLSNTTTCIKKEYLAKDIVAGVFESDKSIKIIRKHK